MTRLWHLLRRLPPLVQDAALALAASVLDVTLFSYGPLLSSPFAYAAVGYVALTWRRRSPLIVFAIIWLHHLIATVFVTGYAPLLGLLIALFTVASECSLRVSRLTLAAAAVPLFVAAAWQAFHQSTEQLSTFAGLALYYLLQSGAAWGAGRWIRVSRLRAADLEYRRAAQAREAINAERTRIARELHDIVAHSVTVMMLQAAVARKALRTDTANADHALSDVNDQGRQAMGELRRMLTALHPAGDGSEPVHEHARPPALEDLDTLLAGVRRTGVTVDLELSGEPAELDPSVGLTAYRVVQEALTNVTRHAGRGARATVRLTWGPDLLITVSDDGRGTPVDTVRALSTGRGLSGLRERVAIAGGQLESGPSTPAGWALSARLPIADRGADPDQQAQALAPR